MLIKIEEHINHQEAIDFVSSNNNGGIATFLGTVRNKTMGKRVLQLLFESYTPMAIAELNKIGLQAKALFPIDKMAVLHVIGIKKPGELVVAIAVSAAHRDAAFDACRYAIDTLKERVPIWKKEYFDDGMVWVAAHP